MTIYITDLTTPDTPKDELHEYHAVINELVDVDVIGVTGQNSKIRRIVLADESDVSEIEDWLGSDLVKE